jgi:hypothetical protein
MDRLRLLVVVLLILAHAPAALAATVRAWVDAIETAAVKEGVLVEAPKNQARMLFDEATITLESAGVLDEQLASFVSRYTRPDPIAIARRSQARFTGDVRGAVKSVKLVWAELSTAAKAEPTLNTIVLELNGAEADSGMQWNQEILRRLARKYGPGSAKLNALETVAAYGLQRVGAKGFGVNATTGYPGPLEVVAAYTATYLTRSDDKTRLVSAAELGLRRYFFRESWGTGSGRLAWLRPSYMSFGVAIAGDSDEPLSSPFSGKQRYGGFLGWGDMKVAYLMMGSNKRLLITQQLQVIPWVF